MPGKRIFVDHLGGLGHCGISFGDRTLFLPMSSPVSERMIARLRQSTPKETIDGTQGPGSQLHP
jgi:hypothetical protein